jgi:hypothetical protein
MTKPSKNHSHKNHGQKGKKSQASGDRLHESDLVIRRFMLNQPNSRLGLQPGYFRNTFSGQEYQSLRANVLLWHRGRVYFEDGQDVVPACKSNDGRQPMNLVERPKAETCGYWNSDGWFVAECPLATWRFYNGRRCSPLCQETWSFLGILEADGFPFWISLKGQSLRSARQFLSMCQEVIKGGQNDLFDCGITLSCQLIQGRSFAYYVARFSDPQWIPKNSAQHRKLKGHLRRYGLADIQNTFDAEQATEPTAALAT